MSPFSSLSFNIDPARYQVTVKDVTTSHKGNGHDHPAGCYLSWIGKRGLLEIGTIENRTIAVLTIEDWSDEQNMFTIRWYQKRDNIIIVASGRTTWTLEV